MDRIVDDFAKQWESHLLPLLMTYGFTSSRKRIENDIAMFTHRKGEQYVELGLNSNILDGPPHCFICLGEGSDEWIETDWNKVELWEFLPDATALTAEPYSIEACGSIHEAVMRVRDDLLKYADDFLNGHLERFYAVRRASVRNRDPYKIYKPKWFGLFGKYVCTVDPESAALKEKYSK